MTTAWACLGRSRIDQRQLRHELKNKAVLWPYEALFTVEKMHLREKATWCNYRGFFFLNPYFWRQKHHFKSQKRDYF